MACRDCVWWEREQQINRAEIWGDCKAPAPANLPKAFMRLMIEDRDGEGCPQFKERTDGE